MIFLYNTIVSLYTKKRNIDSPSLLIMKFPKQVELELSLFPKPDSLPIGRNCGKLSSLAFANEHEYAILWPRRREVFGRELFVWIDVGSFARSFEMTLVEALGSRTGRIRSSMRW
jgi:hypothetical protein